jgi:hypothetical protein
LCAPVNRSQCARGRQDWKFPPHPISDHGDQSAAAGAILRQVARQLRTRIWRRRLRLTFAIRIRMPIFNRWRIRRADSADLSACAWSWWRGARELPARAGAGGGPRARRALSYTHCHAKLAGPRGERAWTRERGPRAAAGYKALCALGLGLLIGLPSTVSSSSEPAVWNRAVPDSRRQTRTGRCAERHGDTDSVLCDRSLRGALC